MDKWQKVRLGEVILFNPTERIAKGAKAKKIAMEKLTPFSKFISEYEVVEFNGGTKFRNGDTLLARITPCLENGKTSQVTILGRDEVGFGSTEFIVMRQKENVSDKDFIFYLSISPQFRDIAIKSMVGSSGRQRVQQSVLDNIEIEFPPLHEQKHIASILSALDDKIELNNRMNKNLEAQAQAIFKSWFVDFEPFLDGEFVDSELGKIPKDWRVGTLGEILNSIKKPIKAGEKTTLPYVPIDIIPIKSLSLSNYKSNEEAQSSLILFQENDILIGAMRVYFHRVVISPFDGITRTTCFVLRPKRECFLEYALLVCNQCNSIDFAQNTSKGSTMPYAVWENGFSELAIIIPDNETLEKFSTIMQPIIERLKKEVFEKKTLTTLRETLLPKLMSGEIRVKTEV